MTYIPYFTPSLKLINFLSLIPSPSSSITLLKLGFKFDDFTRFSFQDLDDHHHHQWREEGGNLMLRFHQVVQGVVLQTPSSVTTITIAWHSLGTSVKAAGGTGPKVGPSGTFPSEAAAGRTGEGSPWGYQPKVSTQIRVLCVMLVVQIVTLILM